jgi:hypothetical protein
VEVAGIELGRPIGTRRDALVASTTRRVPWGPIRFRWVRLLTPSTRASLRHARDGGLPICCLELEETGTGHTGECGSGFR